MKPILAFIILLGAFYTEGVAQTPCQCSRRCDSSALMAFYTAMNGSQWEKVWNDCGLPARHWDFSKPLDSLCSVELRNSRVYGLSLDGILMRGDTVLPDSFFNLCLLEVLSLGYNQTNLNCLFPERQLRQMPLLNKLDLKEAGFYGHLESLNYWRNLTGVFLNYNRLDGIVPRVDSLPNLGNFEINGNQFDSLPPYFNRLKSAANFVVDNNRFTFDDLLPYSSNSSFKYSPQRPFFKDTTYQVRVGETLIIDLGIDKGVDPPNKYYWSKRPLNVRVDMPFTLFDSSNTVNRLVLTNICTDDIGEYKCDVRNPQLPLLTLSTYDSYYYDRHIYINVIGNTRRDTFRKSICKGQTYTRPSGKTTNTEGVYTDTLRSLRNGCDSLIVTSILKVDSLALADVQNDDIIFPNEQMTIELNPLINDKFRVNPIVTLKYDTIKSPYGTIKALTENRFSYTRRPLLSGDIIFNYRICDSLCPFVCDSASMTIRMDDFIKKNRIVITPNGDGRNEMLVFDLITNDSLKYAHNKLVIFNELGQIIYQAQPYNNDWEGTYQNRAPLPRGTYLFLLELNNLERLSGSVTVLR